MHCVYVKQLVDLSWARVHIGARSFSNYNVKQDFYLTISMNGFHGF